MNENLQAKIDEAKAQGYTDEQINAYLNKSAEPAKDESQNQATPFVDRGEEYIGMGEYGGMKAAQYGLEAAGALWAGNKAINKIGGLLKPQAGPVAPTTFTGGANPAFDKALSKPFAEPQPSTVQKATDMVSKIRQMAGEKALAVGSKVAPIAAAAAPYVRGATGIGALTYSGGLNTNEADELRKIREQQAMAARQQGY